MDLPARTVPRRRVRRARRAVRSLPRAIGIVALLLAADLGVGAAWGAVVPDRAADPPPVVTDRIQIGADIGSAVLDGPDAEVFPDDPREDLPAMADYPWRHDYFQELQRAPSTFWPYVMWRPLPATGTYLNILDTWERLTYRSPDSDGPDVPDVDFYGGSTTYGEGQRDLHTIPSEVVRLAEADGLPIRAHNRGVRGWVNWQEMLLFEQLSADPATRPDLALFYDGANERNAQSFAIRGVPAHVDLDGIAQRLSGDQVVSTTESRPASPPPETAWHHARELADDYRRRSAVSRVGRWLRTAVGGDPAGATPVQEDADEDAFPRIYRRGRAAIQGIARRHDVEAIFVWQPLLGGAWPAYDDGIDAPTIDLSQALADRDDVFLDYTHTNEAGARAAAEAIWPHLRPAVEAWYREHR